MKFIKNICLFLSICSFWSCGKKAFEVPVMLSTELPQFNSGHSKASAVQAILDEYTRKGVVGAVVAIKDKEGIWEGVSGYAKIENRQALTPGFVHAGASLTKMYTAAAIMLLSEQGKLALDKAIISYLPVSITSKITNAENITVRMLLNHTSGIPDHLENNFTFKLRWFNDLAKGWTTDEALAEAYNKPLLFNPGTQYSYANNNYMLLSLIISHVVGKEEGAWMQENIFDKLQLGHTYYKTQKEYLDQLPMPNYYLDRYGDGRLQNVSAAAKAEIRSELGDGGLVATAPDFVTFMDALAKGQLVSANSLQEMKMFSKDEYGLGLQNGFNYKGKNQYGHMGAVFGGTAMMLYFEEQQTSLFISSNVDASLVGGKTLFLYHEMKNKIANYIASH